MSKTEIKKTGDKSKKDKPVIKVPKSTAGRAMFAGGQVLAALSVARSLRAARAKGDKLAFVHAALNAATLVITLLLAKRTIRESKQAAESAAAEPLMLPSGK